MMHASALRMLSLSENQPYRSSMVNEGDSVITAYTGTSSGSKSSFSLSRVHSDVIG